MTLIQKSAAEQRLQEIKRRNFEIAVELTEERRSFVIDGRSGDIRRRVALEAERAQLALEGMDITRAAKTARAARRAALNSSAYEKLKDALKALGMDALIAEAEAQAAEGAIQQP